MMIFLCGAGAGAEAVLSWLVRSYLDTAVFTNESAAGDRLAALAREHCLAVRRDVNDRSEWPERPRLLVSVGYLTLIRADVLAEVRGINCHYSLLPRHRGRSSVPWAILEGDQVTGISWHLLTEQIDEGRLLMQAVCGISPRATQASLFDDLHDLAGATAPLAIRSALGGMSGWEQRGRMSYHRAGPPHGGVIDPSWPEDYIERFLRAMTYPPLAYARLDGQEVRTMEEFWQAAAVAYG